MISVFGDNDLLACWLRLGLLARDRGAAETGDRIFLSPADVERTSGRRRADVARTLLERLANLLNWTLERDGNVTVIHFRNFAKKQGFTPRKMRNATQDERNDYAQTTRSPSPSPTEAEKEEKDCASRPAPRGAEAVGFDEFWTRYPVKKGKKATRRVWVRLKPDEALRARIDADVKARLERDADWLRGAIPYPATYLNGERWTDEVRIQQPGPVRGISLVAPAPAPAKNPNVTSRLSCGCETVRTPEGRKVIPCGRHTDRATEVRA